MYAITEYHGDIVAEIVLIPSSYVLNTKCYIDVRKTQRNKTRHFLVFVIVVASRLIFNCV